MFKYILRISILDHDWLRDMAGIQNMSRLGFQDSTFRDFDKNFITLKETMSQIQLGFKFEAKCQYFLYFLKWQQTRTSVM